MLFNEIYGVYYKAAAQMIEAAQAGRLDGHSVHEIVRRCAFPESGLEIEREWREGHWSFLDGTKTSIRHPPKRPWTTLEKRWLKTILMDPRVRLFLPDRDAADGGEQGSVPADFLAQLPDVEPLYLPEDIVYYDRYQDGDPYTDEAYIGRFHTILRALHEKRRISVRFRSGRGRSRHLEHMIPRYLEYSDRDDKFRLYGIAEGRAYMVNLARIRSVELEEGTYTDAACMKSAVRCTDVEFLVKNDTATYALERALMQFCHYKKEVTEEKPGKLYRVRMQIDRSDEKDVVIQLLSFGPSVRLLSPENMVQDLVCRIRNQAALFKVE